MVTSQRRLSLSYKLLLFFAVLLVLPLLFIGYFLHSYIVSDLDQLEKERALNSTHAAQSLINKLGTNLMDVTKTNSHWEDNRAAVERKDVQWLEENMNVSIGIIPNLHFVATMDNEGNIISQAGDVTQFKDKIGYPEILKKLEKEADISGLVNTSKGLAVIAVSKVTNEEGNAVSPGVLIFGRILDQKALHEIKKVLDADISLLSKAGDFITTTQEDKKETLEKYLLHASTNSSLEIFQTTKVQDMLGAEVYASINDLFGQSVGIIHLSYPTKAKNETITNISKASFIAISIIVLLLIAVTLLLHRSMIKPMVVLSLALEKVANASLTEKVPGKYLNRNDEIGQISGSLQKMINNLQEMIQQINRTVDHLTVSSKDLTCNAEETNKFTYQIVSSIQEVASGTEVQAQGALDSKKAIQDMASGIQYIAVTSALVSEASHEAEQEATKGNLSVEKAVVQMGNIKKSVGVSSAIIDGLADRSKEIGQIVDVITKIASKTNLLALNAGIEAARAGDHGRGFAIVAEEVRQLAEQTAASANQIIQLIQAVQADAVRSVDSMNQVTQEVEEGMTVADEAVHAFAKNLAALRDIAEKIGHVSASSEQMSALTEELSSAVENMSQIAQESAAKSFEVSSLTQEQLAALEEISSSADSLSLEAVRLNEMVSQFQV